MYITNNTTMSAPAPQCPAPQGEHHEPAHWTPKEGFLTARGKKTWGKTLKVGGIFAAGALAVLAFQNCGWNKNYDAPNQRPIAENPEYHNNGQEITLDRLLAASNMFNAGHNSLVGDSFNNLFDQIDNTLDKKISLFSDEQNAHLNHGTNGKESYHAYIGINEQGGAKEIYVSWHLPEPTDEQKKNGAVATHKVRFVYYPGQKSIQRFDQHSNWDETGPKSYSYDELQKALKDFGILFN